MKRFLGLLWLVGLCCALLTSSGTAFAEDRCLYVNDFSCLFGNASSEHALLQYAKDRSVNCLLLYELHLILGRDAADPQYVNHYAENSAKLGNFLETARGFGIDRIAATGDTATFFSEVIDPYNREQTAASRRFDVYHLELEYWNGAVSFAEYLDRLQQIRALADANPQPAQVETYLGWPTEAEVSQIDDLTDRVLLHAYVNDPASAFDYTKERLQYFASNNQTTDVSIIFSSETSFMQTWLEDNCMRRAEEMYQTAYDAAPDPSWQDYIQLTGFTYFAYTFAVNAPLNWPEDLNGDGDVNIFDLQRLINKIFE